MIPSAARPLLFAAALLALPLAARAAPPDAVPDAVHVLSVALPDGTVARIRYVGNVPPVLTLRPPVRPVAMAAFGPASMMPAAFAADPGFAALARMQLAMQRETGAMLRRAALLEAAMMMPERDAAFAAPIPAAADGAGCVVGTRITRVGNAAPQVVSFRSAGCGGAFPAVVPGTAADRVPVPRRLEVVPGAARPLADAEPRLIEARADQAAPPSLIR